MLSFELPADPADLASIRAEQMPFHGDSHGRADQLVLAELERAAADLGFLGAKWLVESGRCLSLPVSFEAREPTKLISFMGGLLFEGELVTFSRVTIGEIIGNGQGHEVDALCLAFDGVTLLPYFDGLPPDHLLHVPALSVESIIPQQ